jgi:hypothetical protein
VFVVRQPNTPSGGPFSRFELGDFLSCEYGPEREAWVEMIETLIYPDAAGLLMAKGTRGSP